VLFVTTLMDYRPGERPIEGSLRKAVETAGPRTILFRVSGIIELEHELVIAEPYLTIAGQSAPGEGIVLKNYGVNVDAPQVILRYLRVRPGDETGLEGDAINIRSPDVIVDHCSATWATDETVSVVGDATNVTVQWCLIAESLNRSIHPKGEHGYGSLLSTSGDVTIHHTIYAFHKSRNPRPRDGLLDFRNNLIYGHGDRAGYNENDRTRMNYVANYVYPLAYSDNARYAFLVGGAGTRLFLKDNVLRSGEGLVRDDWSMIRPPSGMQEHDARLLLGRERPFPAPTVRTTPPDSALRWLLEAAGATRPGRDAADRRIIGLIRSGQGQIIDSQHEVGGWPELAGAAAPQDGDRDGMPDAWERDNGLDPANPEDHRADLDQDGYTNLEEYLNETDPRRPFAWVEPPELSPPSGAVFVDPPLRVTIRHSNPALPIHYTLDGTEPDAASPRYGGPIHLDDSAYVRARVIDRGKQTTAAFAEYRRIEWLDANERDDLSRGLRYAIYRADDWDEGVDIDDLRPERTGISDSVDFALRSGRAPEALVFDGFLTAPQDGIYAFYFRDDPRSRLFLNGEIVTMGSAQEVGRVALREGIHRFVLRSVQEEPRSAALRWSGPGFDAQPLPPHVLFHDRMNP